MMDQWFLDAANLYASNSKFIGPAIGLVAGVLGTLIFGRNYKRRIETLESRGSTPTINITITPPHDVANPP